MPNCFTTLFSRDQDMDVTIT